MSEWQVNKDLIHVTIACFFLEFIPIKVYFPKHSAEHRGLRTSATFTDLATSRQRLRCLKCNTLFAMAVAAGKRLEVLTITRAV